MSIDRVKLPFMGMVRATMGMEAAMSYLKALRDGRKISQRALADAMTLAGYKVDDRQIRRWESGRPEPSFPETMKLIELVQGSIDHVRELIDNPAATSADGEKLAYRWLSSDAIEYINGQVDSLGDEEMEEALDIVQELKQKNKMSELINFGRYLRGS